MFYFKLSGKYLSILLISQWKQLKNFADKRTVAF